MSTDSLSPKKFSIWVDADSCPLKIREVVAKAALRLSIPTYFVANHSIPFSSNEFTQMVVVPQGEGVADDYIVQKASEGDLAITRDIPLANRLIEKSLVVLNDRGDFFTADNIKERLSVRNWMYELRSYGFQPERQTQMGAKEIQKFSAIFDRELTKLIKKNRP